MQSAHDQEIEGSIPAFAFIKESAVQKFARCQRTRKKDSRNGVKNSNSTNLCYAA